MSVNKIAQFVRIKITMTSELGKTKYLLQLLTSKKNSLKLVKNVPGFPWKVLIEENSNVEEFSSAPFFRVKHFRV